MRRRRPGQLKVDALSLFALSTSISPVSAQTYRVAWTTDLISYPNYNGVYGPDGPWQAIALSVGNTTITYLPPSGENVTSDILRLGDEAIIPPNQRGFRGAFSPMWPSGGGMSTVYTTKVPGGNYTPEESTTCIDMGTLIGNGDDWAGYSAHLQDSWGKAVYDIVTLADGSQIQMGDDFSGRQYLSVNATLAATEQAVYILPSDDGTEKTRYTPLVGTLGLGQAPRGMYLNEGPESPVGVLKALKENGVIGYEGFSLHMGSVMHKQPGSLILGGYEKNRALGQLGTFKFNRDEPPYMFLVDVLLGTQIPGTWSEFVDGSIWQAPDERPVNGSQHSATFMRQALGGKGGSAVVVPNPAVPYIYLPQGICETVAERLPLVYDKRLHLYTWDVDDPAYGKLMESSAYMAFVLSDSAASNLTIKVPFQLLNLTLEPPLVDEPTPYFPCQSLDSFMHGFWTLGRAFLQAAFFGVDYERNLTYLAQAPGPITEQRVVKDFALSGEAIETNDIAQLESSWMGLWKTVDGNNVGSPAAEQDSVGLSAGAIAGVVVGAVVGMGILGFAVLKLLMRKRSSGHSGPASPSVEKMDDDRSGEKVELDTERDVSELGVPTAHEMDSPGVFYEAQDPEKEVRVKVNDAPDAKLECVELPADVPIKFHSA